MANYQFYVTINTPVEERRKRNIGDIYLNQIKCNKCNDIITSYHRHDFKWCKCGESAVDGGSWYTRRAFKTEPNYTELSIMFNDIKEDKNE